MLMTVEGKPKVGAPITKPFKQEYCRMLIDHMRQGNSIESFGALIQCGVDQIYEYIKKYPEFAEAKSEGVALSRLFYEQIGKAIMTGQLKRVQSEKPMIGPDGQVLVDPRTGEVLKEVTYANSNGSATAWIFLMKCRFGYRDAIYIAADPDHPLTVQPIPPANLTDDQLKQRFIELAKKALAEEKDA